MASQVPYTGVPDVSPQVDPLSKVGVDAPIAAFGGAVAGAVTHLGETVEGAGKELFARAIAFQTIDQQNKADAASSDTNDKMMQRALEYDKLKGQDRSDGFNDYMKDINKLRQDGAADLESPYAKEQYLRDSRRTQSSMIMYGGRMARQGQEEVLRTNKDDGLASISNRAAVTGDFARGDTDHMKRVAGAFVTADKGLHPGDPNYDTEVTRELSPHVAKVIASQGRDPMQAPAAKAKLEAAVKAGVVQPEDALRVGAQLDSTIETRTAHETGVSIARGDPKHWGDEPYSTDVATKGIMASPGTSGSFNSVGADLKDGTHPVGKYGPNSALLATELPKAGLTNESGGKVVTEEDFRNSPKAQKQFAETVFPRLQEENKTFSGAFKAWTGSDDPNRLNSALQAVAKAAPPAMVADKARKVMSDLAPNAPVAGDTAAEIGVSHQNTAKRIDDVSAAQVRNEAIQYIDGSKSQDGRVPRNLTEALQDKDFADRYHSLPEPEQEGVRKKLMDNDKRGGVIENGVGQHVFSNWRNIAINRDISSSPKELEDFLNLNIATLPVTLQHASELVKLQHEVMQDKNSNPLYKKAMGTPAVQKVLGDAGISKANTPDEYNTFTNSYHDAIKNYQEGADRAVKSDEELADIAKGLIGTKPGMMWGTNPDLKYKDIYGSVPANIKILGQQAFSKEFQRAYDPDNAADKDSMNRVMNWMIFEAQGRGKRSKSSERAQ